MRYIKSYTQHINENYIQAKALGEKNKIDITPILKMLIQSETNNIKDDTKYPIPYNIEKERKNRVYIGLFTRLYCDYAETNGVDFMMSLMMYEDAPEFITPVYDYIMSNKAPLNIVNNKTNEVTVLSNILDIYKVVEKNDDGRSALETLTDAISSQKIDNNVKEWINKMPSGLKHMFNNDISEKDNLKSLIITYMSLSDEIKADISNTFFGKTGKISAYKTTQKFIEDLDNLIKSKEENFENLVKLAESRKDIDIRYINPHREILVVSVHTFNASQIFGEKVSWCISREKHYFKNYYNEGDRQLIFIINMKETDIDMSKIGVCVSKMGIYAAHDKKDVSLDDEVVYGYLASNKIPDSSIAYKETDISKLIKNIYTNDGYIKYFDISSPMYNYDMCVMILDILDINDIYKVLNNNIAQFLEDNTELFEKFINKQPLVAMVTRYMLDNHTWFFMNNYKLLWNREADYLIESSTFVDISYELQDDDKVLEFVRYLHKIGSRNIKNLVCSGAFVVLFSAENKTPDILDIFDFKSNIVVILNTSVFDTIVELYESGITLSYIQQYCGISEINITNSFSNFDRKYIKNVILSVNSFNGEDETPNELKDRYTAYIEKFGEEKFVESFYRINTRRILEIIQQLLKTDFKYMKCLANDRLDLSELVTMIAPDYIDVLRFYMTNNEYSSYTYKMYIENKVYEISDLIPGDILKEFLFRPDLSVVRYITHEFCNIDKNVSTDITCINMLFNIVPQPIENREFILKNVDFSNIKPEFIYYKTPKAFSKADEYITYMCDELFELLYVKNKLPVNQKLNVSRSSVLDDSRVKCGVEKFGLKI